MVDWFQDHQTFAWWLIAFSAVSFVATLVLVPISLTRLPADYFTASDAAHGKSRGDTPLARVLWRIGKNALGYVFIISGILMLVLPGQGILSIVAGIMLIEFPRKRRLLRWLVARGPVLRFINRRREHSGREPLSV